MIGWWTLRPRDEGRGYNGFHLSIADTGILKPTWFEDDTLEGVIGKALDFIRKTWPERFEEEQPKPKKRTVKRR